MPEESIRLVHASGECEIDLARRELRVLGSPVPVGGRAFEIIEVLARSAGELVTKNQLMDRVWPGAIVTESTLHVHAAAIRKALGPKRSLLKTESGRGYRLLGDWTARRHGAPTPPVGVQQVQVDGESPVTNIPAAVTRLVGRKPAVVKLRDLISAYRVVTLTGPGGIGKTSLALKVARGIVGEFADGGWLVELATLSDPALVPMAVAGALRLPPGPKSVTPETVAQIIGDKRLLLVLDNCEHIVEAVATLAETILAHCPHTAIVTTSREILRIQGEHVYRVPPLEVPAAGLVEADHILNHSAVELFIARTRQADAGFSPRAGELGSIGAICRHLDGIPLAIEFAAAQASTFGLQPVADRLHDRFALLTRGRRTALPQHRTLRAVLDWSYELLSEAEQRLLRHLGIFSGGFTFEAAAAVMNDGADGRSSAMDGIANLLTKSLIAQDRDVPSRWYLLETIRAYAVDKLASHGERDSAAWQHSEFYRNLFVSRTHDARLLAPDEDMAAVIRELDNVRAALDWSFSPAGNPEIGVALTAAYVPAWLHAALPAECRERTERALTCLTPDMQIEPPLRMQLHFAFGLMPAYTMSPVEPAKAALTTALGYAEEIGDRHAQFQILWGLWVLNATGGECFTAQAVTDRLSTTAQQIGDLTASLMARRLQGFVLQQMGKHHEARQCFEHVIQHYVPPSDWRLTAWGQFDQRVLARAMLARSLWLQGYAEQAMNEARQCLAEAQRTNLPLSIGEALRVALCDIALMTGDLPEAGQAIAMLIDIATSRNAPFWEISGRCLRGKLLVIRGKFAAGVALLRTELEFCERTGWAIWYPEFVAALAEGLAGLGQIAAALVAVNKGLASADSGGERIWYAELLRLKGELLLGPETGRSTVDAESCFSAAIALARQQGALSLELRAALSFARLCIAQHRPDEAQAILAPVHARFIEGFETPDLRAAKAMLDALSG